MHRSAAQVRQVRYRASCEADFSLTEKPDTAETSGPTLLNVVGITGTFLRSQEPLNWRRLLGTFSPTENSAETFHGYNWLTLGRLPLHGRA